MEALRCPPGDMAVDNLSGGEKRRIALTRLLIQKPDILLLDEPTNHLDAELVEWLENHLKEYAGAVLMITHDRYFLDHVVGWILELDRGKYFPYEGNYSTYLETKAKRLAQEEREESGKQKALQRELEWIRQTPAARQTKSKARVRKFEELQNAQDNRPVGKAQIVIQVPERLGSKVIEINNVSKAYGDKLLFEDLSLHPAARRHRRHHRPERRRQVHPVPPDHRPGEARHRRDRHRPDRAPRLRRPEPRSPRSQEERLGGDFRRARLHDGQQAGDLDPGLRRRVQLQGRRPAEERRQASGGERNRVHIAKMLKTGGNVLLLDEPTNDLDVETLAALEDAIENFAGCAVVISHDRFFLDRLATHILAFEGNSHVEWFEGNFESYEEDKRRRMGDAADRPTRLAYKKLTR